MKKVTILDGISNEKFNGLESDLAKEYKENLFIIRDMNINYCCGCWKCWVSTPGECIPKDDMPIILKSVMNSDLVLYLSDIKMGFISSELKKVTEKMIPLVLPYIRIYDGECHHKPRYAKVPKFGVVLLNDEDIDKEIIEINKGIYDRLARNFHTNVEFFITSKGEGEGILNEIINF